MALDSFVQDDGQIILNTERFVCVNKEQLLKSDAFTTVVVQFCEHLRAEKSPLLKPFQAISTDTSTWELIVSLLRCLAVNPLADAVKQQPELAGLLDYEMRQTLHEFAEELYNYWRSFNRYMVIQNEYTVSDIEVRPYRSFNETIETLAHVVRATYRDICENITGDHPRIYRQVAAGCNVGLIAVPRSAGLPKLYAELISRIRFIRQVWIAPPLILDPPMNTRSGQFQKVGKNFCGALKLEEGKWLCYPAQVGSLIIFVYFHRRFMGLGCSLANLFELATDEQIAQGPDALFFYGVDRSSLSAHGDVPTVFFDDEENKLLVGAVPCESRFGYFGYLKKMILTLHNAAAMKRGMMPFHGAMVRISLKSGSGANVLIIGDTATGKSESLEALRLLGREAVERLHIVADDMGSLKIDKDNRILAYGTETGAFIRLDDLQQGYAFQQIDRAIIMSPQKINARVVLPVTTIEEVKRGCVVDYLLYANNYEAVDEDHPALEQFGSCEQALHVFRDGAAMAKGTTSSTGLGHCYFANIFGPPQYRDLHEDLAQEVFKAAFASGIYVGQLRTRLGIAGQESAGPQEAARALLGHISAS